MQVGPSEAWVAFACEESAFVCVCAVPEEFSFNRFSCFVLVSRFSTCVRVCMCVCVLATVLPPPNCTAPPWRRLHHVGPTQLSAASCKANRQDICRLSDRDCHVTPAWPQWSFTIRPVAPFFNHLKSALEGILFTLAHVVSPRYQVMGIGVRHRRMAPL